MHPTRLNISILALLAMAMTWLPISPLASGFSFAAETGKLEVVASMSIIGDWVRNVGGDDVEVITLVGPDGDPHEYQPVPADSLKLSKAAVIFENGLGLETWLQKLCESAQTRALRVVITDSVLTRRAPTADTKASNGNDGERDPHAWQDVRNAIVMVNNIRDALVKADPAHADGYKARADAYDNKLEDLNRDIAKAIQSIPPNRRKLVTSHNAFGYFGARYGIEVSRGALESVTTEAADPSARQIAEVVDQIKASGIPVIFLENIQNPKLIRQIADEADVKVGPALYSDALGQSGTEGETYIKMMRYNTNVLVQSLKP